MAERTLTVRLRAIADGYTKALDSAAKATDDLVRRADRVTAWGKQAQDTGKKITTGISLPIAAIGAGALFVAGQYEAGMREVQALTGATAEEMAMLSDQAKKMGADTKFSAQEAAAAMAQLVKGGFDVQETYDALPGVMQLAAAATIDIASAADIATNVLTGFGLEVNELAKVNDYLSETANSSDTDVRELGEAFKYVGPVAKGAGLSLAETSATFALMAENGIRGSMAGTSLRGVITSLLNPSAKVKGIMDELGLSVQTSSGQLVGMEEIIRQLQESGATAGDIMAVFGDRAGSAMVPLVTAGSNAMADFTTQIEESRGVAQELADAKMGGLTGAIEELRGSLETLAITMGEAGLSDFFTGLAKMGTNAVNTLGEMPRQLQQVALGLAGIAVASGPAIWALGKMAALYGPVVTGARNAVLWLTRLRGAMILGRAMGLSYGAAMATIIGPQGLVIAGVAALAAGLYLASRAAKNFEKTHTDAADAAEQLGESAGLALREIGGEEMEDAAVSADDFRRANENALETLRKMRTETEQGAYLSQIGYELVLRGASPEDAFDQITELAEAAGIEVPVNLTVSNIGDFQDNVRAMVERVRGQLPTIQQDESFSPEIGNVGKEVAEQAALAFQTDNIAGFVQMLAASEDAMGDNGKAIDNLVDHALKFVGVQGLSTDTAYDTAGALAELTSAASSATGPQKALLLAIMDRAEAMGGLTTENLRAAAAEETAGYNASEYANEAERVAAETEGAGSSVDGFTGELEENADAADEAMEAVSDYLDSVSAAIDPFFQLADAVMANEDAQRNLTDAQRDLEELKAGRLSAEDEADGMRRIEDAVRSVEDAYRSLEDAQYGVLDAREKLADINEDLADAQADLVGVTEGTVEYDEGMDKLKDLTRRQRDASRGVEKSLRREADARREIEDANRRAREAEEALAKERADAIPTNDELREAERKVAEAQLRSAASAMDVLAAATELRVGIENGTVSQGEANAMLGEWASQGLISADTALTLSSKFGDLEGKAQDVGLGILGIIAALNALEERVNNEPEFDWFGDVGDRGPGPWRDGYVFPDAPGAPVYPFGGGLPDPFGGGSFGGGRAAGGPMDSNKFYLTGENGPELAFGPGTVVPANITAAIMSGSLTPAGSAFTDGRIVERLDNVEAAIQSAGRSVSITYNRPDAPTADDNIRAMRTAEFMDEGTR